MPASVRWRRAGLLTGGILLGLVLILVGTWVYIRSSQFNVVRDELAREIGVPREALEIERLAPGEPVRIALREVVLLEPDGDTILIAPRLRFAIGRVALAPGSPVVVSDAEVLDPYLRLVQRPDGEWNVFGALRVEAGGEEVRARDDEPGRTLLIRGMRIVNGRVLIATPWEPPSDTAAVRFAARREDVQLARIDGRLARTFTFLDVDARMPLVRVGGDEGWRVVVADLDARLADGNLRIQQIRGAIEATPDDGIRFALDEFRTANSLLEGSGIIRLADGETTRADLDLIAQPLAFADLQWLFPSLPDEGQARIALSVETQDDGRLAIQAQDVAIAGLDSRITGDLTVLAGGDAPAEVTGGELLLDPLDLRVLEVLGLEEQLPFAGQVRGTLAAAQEEGSGLAVNLTAALVPRDSPAADTSTITAAGQIGLGGADAPFRLERFNIGLTPLHLSTLRPLLPEQQERLVGELRGGVALTGTPADLRLEEGELVFDAGTAVPARLAGITGRITREPALRYEIHAAAEPLALAPLSEVFPALPFRTAQLAGPIELAGTADSLRFGLDLRGDAGAIDATGKFAFADPLRFEVSGELEAFRTSEFIRRELPVEGGPVSGTFAARGTLEDFRFDVDLAQPAGRLALDGRVRRPGDALQADVSGEVANFRIGTLLGRPGLLPAPVSGSIQVAGGGRQPIRFDVDVRAAPGAEPALIDVEGWFAPGDVPSYAVSGAVAGLDLQSLPFGDPLPRTRLAATAELSGSGTDPESLAAQLNFVAGSSSTVAGRPLEAAIARLAVRNGVLRVDTMRVVLGDARFAASGMWGLTQPTPEPLRFTLSAPSLASLAPLLAAMPGEQPPLAGALSLNGVLEGSLDDPVVAVALRGRNLRYGEWRTGSLALDANVADTPLGWTGEATLAAASAVLAGRERLESLRFQAVARPGSLAVGLAVRRDGEADLALSGVADLTGGWEHLRGVGLETFSLRLGGSTWQLAGPTQLRWGGVDGVAIDGLVLRRTGQAEGLIAVDGRLPPTGTSDLRIQAEGIDIGDVRRILPEAPEIDGVLSLNAIVEGPVNSPELSLEARVTGPRFRGAAVDTISVSAKYADGRMEVAGMIWAAESQAAFAEASVPMLLSLEGLTPSAELSENEPMSARLLADSLPLGFLVAALPQVSEGAGFFTGEVRAEGTPADPVLTGSAIVSDGALTLDLLDIRYTGIDGRLSLANDLIRIDSLDVRSGGTATLSGTIQVDDPSQPQLYLTATLNDFQPAGRADLATVEATGRLALSGRLPTPVLTGRITVDDGTVAVPAIGEPTPFEITDVEVGGIGADTVPLAAAEPSLAQQIRIDGLEVAIGEGVWVQSANDARVQIGGELLVYRAGEDLRVYGDLLAQRGTYTLRVGPITREFDVVSGTVRFFGTPDLNPSLDIVASHRIRTATATSGSVLNVLVQITGTVQSPSIQLTSDTRPPLPESELLSYLIFGRPSFELGGATNQLAEQLIVQEFAGGLVLGPLEQALLRTGLFDYVRIRGRPTGELGDLSGFTLGSTAVEVGKELFTNVFWTIECSIAPLLSEGETAPACGTSLDWQIDNQWSTSLSYAPLRRDWRLRQFVGTQLRYQGSAELRRRWEYGRPRGEQTPTPQPQERTPLPGQIAPPAPAEPQASGGQSPDDSQQQGAPR